MMYNKSSKLESSIGEGYRTFHGVKLSIMAACVLAICSTSPLSARISSSNLPKASGGSANGCGGDGGCPIVEIDNAHWQQLESVQASLWSIRRVDDRKAFGNSEYWQVASKAGDCEDIALAARQRLLAAGWPPSAVRLATAWTETGDYHTVLTIDGVRDNVPSTYVLDSRFASVLSWQKLEKIGYRFHIRQASSGPNWVTIQS